VAHATTIPGVPRGGQRALFQFATGYHQEKASKICVKRPYVQPGRGLHVNWDPVARLRKMLSGIGTGEICGLPVRDAVRGV